MKIPTAAELLRLLPGDRRPRLALHARHHRVGLAAAMGDDRQSLMRRTRHGHALRRLAAVSRSVGAYVEDIPMDRPDRIVAEIPRASRESVRVVLREKRGSVACEMRIARQNPRGLMIETPQGVRLPLARLRAAIEALEAAEREALRLGLIPAAELAATRLVG